MGDLGLFKVDKDGAFMPAFVELNKGIVRTLEMTINELPFWKFRKKRQLFGCIIELEEYIEDLIN